MTTVKKQLNLEKYRRRQDKIAERLLEIASRNPFAQIVKSVMGPRKKKSVV